MGRGFLWVMTRLIYCALFLVSVWAALMLIFGREVVRPMVSLGWPLRSCTPSTLTGKFFVDLIGLLFFVFIFGWIRRLQGVKLSNVLWHAIPVVLITGFVTAITNGSLLLALISWLVVVVYVFYGWVAEITTNELDILIALALGSGLGVGFVSGFGLGALISLGSVIVAGLIVAILVLWAMSVETDYDPY